MSRAADMKSRFQVRSRMETDGVLSNLYPIFDVAALPCGGTTAAAKIFVYEMYVTCRALAKSKKARESGGAADSCTTDGSKMESERRVSSRRCWQAVQRYFSSCRDKSCPPVVCSHYRLYCPTPLPEELRRVPQKFRDVGWQTCDIRFVSGGLLMQLPPTEIQQVVNKLVMQAARAAMGGSGNRGRRSTGGPLSVVREKTGKLVCVSEGISADGLRIYQGVVAHAIFVDISAAEKSPLPLLQSGAEGEERHDRECCRGLLPTPPSIAAQRIAEMPTGQVLAGQLIQFVVRKQLLPFHSQGKRVELFVIADDAGMYLATVMQPTIALMLKEGQSYAASGLIIQSLEHREYTRQVEIPPHATVRLWSSAKPPDHPDAGEGPPTSSSSFALPGHLSLKIDPKGTIASEMSLWDEVVMHHGMGPFDAMTQRRIADTLRGVPVVVSYSMRQSIVKSIHFNWESMVTTSSSASPSSSSARGAAAGTTMMPAPRPPDDPYLLPLMPRLDAGQPCAILMDDSMLPLQVLHCCYDPRMRGWMDAALPALSLFPPERMRHLSAVRAVLAEGLQKWGLHLGATPWHSRAVQVLPPPLKRKDAAAASSPLPHLPTTVVIVGITGGADAAAAQQIVSAAAKVAALVPTHHVSCVDDEAAAVQYLAEQLLDGGSAATDQTIARDPNACAIVITPNRDTRAARWVKVECLSRGVLPIFMKPPRTVSRVFGGNIKMMMRRKFTADPLKTLDWSRNVPALTGRRILAVGVDACHTASQSTGSIVAIYCMPCGSRVSSLFWRHDERGAEVRQVAKYMRRVFDEAKALLGDVDEVVVFQDGNISSEAPAIEEAMQGSGITGGLTLTCLHKRSNIRFVYCDSNSPTMASANTKASNYFNSVKGVVVPAVTPVVINGNEGLESFYLQAHESCLSTARTVQYTVHHASPTLATKEVQRLAYMMSNILSTQSTKLPLPTRCAHLLAGESERLLDAVPLFDFDMIPPPLCQRLWYL